MGERVESRGPRSARTPGSVLPGSPPWSRFLGHVWAAGSWSRVSGRAALKEEKPLGVTPYHVPPAAPEGQPLEPGGALGICPQVACSLQSVRCTVIGLFSALTLGIRANEYSRAEESFKPVLDDCVRNRRDAQ